MSSRKPTTPGSGRLENPLISGFVRLYLRLLKVKALSVVAMRVTPDLLARQHDRAIDRAVRGLRPP
jgi:hypothetical protein